jgi:hypothetical protein
LLATIRDLLNVHISFLLFLQSEDVATGRYVSELDSKIAYVAYTLIIYFASGAWLAYWTTTTTTRHSHWAMQLPMMFALTHCGEEDLTYETVRTRLPIFLGDELEMRHVQIFWVKSVRWWGKSTRSPKRRLLWFGWFRFFWSFGQDWCAEGIRVNTCVSPCWTDRLPMLLWVCCAYTVWASCVSWVYSFSCLFQRNSVLRGIAGIRSSC